MSLQQAVTDRLRPWHGVMLAVFLVGAGQSALTTDGAVTVGFFPVLLWVITGLMWVVGFQFTVGNVWAYVVEYYNAGGAFRDAPVVVPVGAGLVAGTAIGWRVTEGVVGSLWFGVAGGFGVFVVAALVVRFGANLAAGYRAA